MTIDTILFDWDGTLIDTAQQAFEAFQKALLDLGISLDPATYERIYSPNWYSMYEKLGLAKEKWKEADGLWIRHYANQLPQLLPGTKEALQDLASGGYSLGIVTSGSRDRVLSEIESLGLTHVFRIVVCSDDVVNRKPHPEGLQIAIEKLQKRPEDCCYVGDCPEDIEMGHRAGVMTIGIQSQYPASRKLPESKPDLVFSSLDQLVQKLSSWDRRRLAGSFSPTKT